MDLQQSDFEHFNVLGNFYHQILHRSNFLATSTIRFCILQGFLWLQPSDFVYFSDYSATSTISILRNSMILSDFNLQILPTSMFHDTSTIRFFVIPCIRQLQPVRFFLVQCFLPSSTIRLCILQGFMRLLDFAYFKVLGGFKHQILCVIQGITKLQPSDFSFFNVLGNFHILRSSMFSVISTIRFCAL